MYCQLLRETLPHTPAPAGWYKVQREWLWAAVNLSTQLFRQAVTART